MARRPKRSVEEKQALASIGGRLKTIANLKYGSSPAELAGATGVSPQTWSRVLAGQQAPSWKLLAALFDLGVNVEWVLAGRGYPFLEDAREHRAGEQTFLVAKAILAGPPDQHREQLVGLDLHVTDLTQSRSRYWLQIQDGDPIVREASAGIRAGDLLQLESDPSYWLTNLQRLRDAEIGAFRVSMDQGQLLALGQIEVVFSAPDQSVSVSANIFGLGKMPVDLATAVLSPRMSELGRKAKAEFGKELRCIDLTCAEPPNEQVPAKLRLAELIAVKVDRKSVV
jgi:transcriptional regulator with XRE-family HTH domain